LTTTTQVGLLTTTTGELIDNNNTGGLIDNNTGAALDLSSGSDSRSCVSLRCCPCLLRGRATETSVSPV